MKLSDIYINGYRSIANVRWQPQSLNVLIGPNASGKTNFLRALQLFSGAAFGDLSELVRLEGGMGAIVFDGEKEDIVFDLTAAEESAAGTTTNLRYRVELDRIGSTSSFRIGREFLGAPEEFDETHESKEGLINRENAGGTFVSALGSSSRMDITNVGDESALLSNFGAPITLNPATKKFQQYLAGWRLYGNFDTTRNSSIRQAQVARYETAVDTSGSNLVAVLHTLYESDRDFKDDLDLAMKAAFGEEFERLSFPPAADQRVQLRLRWRSLKTAQSAADLSDGTLRFLCLLAILASPNLPSLIAIEEPEIGLHPSMLPILAEYLRDASLRSQVIVTTHSPELLDAFGSETPSTVVVESRDGMTSLTPIEGEKLQYWLKQYTLGELFRSNELEAM